MRYQGTLKPPGILAPKIYLQRFIKSKKFEMSNQGKGLFGNTITWPAEIKFDSLAENTETNYNPQNCFKNLIIPTDGEQEPPMV